MKILVTGGLGHIGSYIIENISKIKSIRELYVIDNLYSNKINSLFNLRKKKAKLFFINKDLSKKDSLKNFKKVDIVINLASITDAEKSLEIKREIYKNNLGIFNNVVAYCRKKSSKLIHISSTSVYGKQSGIVDEKCKKLRPQTPYAKIKILEENILIKNSTKISYITFRFGTIAGISKGMRFHTAVNKFCLFAILNKPIPVWKDALYQFRPYLSLRDAFKIVKFTLEKKFFTNQIYNILSNNYKVNDILKMIKKYKKNIRVKFVKSKIINQLSYKVKKEKIISKGIFLNANLDKDIKQTLNLFKNINNGM
tara:strand:- start:421 stop:1353 length:933 start_codon:yes stop_codon:yes gene_type:complete